jgi:hypothetical protein
LSIGFDKPPEVLTQRGNRCASMRRESIER